MQLRKYSPKKDFGALVDLVREFCIEQRKISGKPQIYSRKKAIESVKNDFPPSATNITIIAEEKGKKIGYLRLKKLEGSWFMRELSVIKEYRGKGVGTRLFKKAVSLLRQKRVPALYLGVLSSNSNALFFYRELGMNRINSIELELRLDRKKLKKHGKIKIDKISFEY